VTANRNTGYRYLAFRGTRVAYQVVGAGPAVVLIKNNRVPEDLATVRLLAPIFRVFQVHPIGFGASERPHRFAFGDVGPQVIAVMDQEGVERFVVWGFSQCAAMAAMVAAHTSRAAALIAGGFPLLGVPTDGEMRRMEREPRMPRPALEFWRAYRQVDWPSLLRRIECPKLAYVGAEDPAHSKLYRSRNVLSYLGVEYLEFPDLGHAATSLAEGLPAVTEAVTDWLSRRLPNGW
jgi:pimeloyl-ACP methyl ester carboxylesterase